ncbi:MAG: glycosyltransferase [Mycoplasmatales bacterium]
MRELRNFIFVSDSVGAQIGGVTQYRNTIIEYIRATYSNIITYELHLMDYSKTPNAIRAHYSYHLHNDEQEITNLFKAIDPRTTIIIFTKFEPYLTFLTKYSFETITFPTILEYHGNMEKYLEESSWLRNIFIPSLVKSNRVNIIKVLSKNDKNILKKHIEKVIYIYHTTKMKNNRITKKNKTVGYVGRLSKIDKNVEALRRVIEQTYKKDPTIEFHIFGIGPDSDVIKNISEGNYIMHGLETDKDKIFNNLNILLSTSKSEGWGLSILEAIANGIPVITTKSTNSLFEMLNEERNCVFEHHEIDNLIERIVELSHNDDERERISIEVFNKSKIFCDEVQIEKYLDVIEKVIKENEFDLKFEVNNLVREYNTKYKYHLQRNSKNN